MMLLLSTLALAQSLDFDEVTGDLSADAPVRERAPLYVSGELAGYPAAYPVRLQAGQVLEVDFTCKKKCLPTLEIDGAGFDHALADEVSKKRAFFRQAAPASGVAVIHVSSVAGDEAVFVGPYTFFALRNGAGAASLPPDTPPSEDTAPVEAAPVEGFGLGGGRRPPTEPVGLCDFITWNPKDAPRGWEGSRGAPLGDDRFATVVQLEGGDCHVTTARIQCDLARGSLESLRAPTLQWAETLRSECTWPSPPMEASRDPWAIGLDPVGVRIQAGEPSTGTARLEVVDEGEGQAVLRFILQ